MRAHVVKNGIIINTIIVDSLDAIPGVELIEATSGTMGDLWDGTNITPRPKYDTVEQARTAALSEVDRLRLQKTFTDIAVDFPSGDKKEIQFRNEFDMSNLMSVATAGIALIVSGTPAAEVVYRTKDNTTQTLTAAQMVAIGMAVLSAKQAVVSAAWAHKDAIRQLETIKAVEKYDLTKGWPE